MLPIRVRGEALQKRSARPRDDFVTGEFLDCPGAQGSQQPGRHSANRGGCLGDRLLGFAHGGRLLVQEGARKFEYAAVEASFHHGLGLSEEGGRPGGYVGVEEGALALQEFPGSCSVAFAQLAWAVLSQRWAR